MAQQRRTESLTADLAPPEDDPSLRVVEGSELVTDPLPSGCTTGGYLAVLEVTGELMPVMRGYLQQFTRTTAFTSEGLVGDEEEPRAFADAAGGGSLSASGVAGLLMLSEQGRVPAGARIVITVTGHGLKDPQWALRTADGSEVVPVRISSDVVSIATALGLD